MSRASAGSGLLVRPLPPGHRWQVEVSLAAMPHLGDHAVNGAVVLPGSTYLEALAEIAAQLDIAVPLWEDLRFERALILPRQGGCRLVVELTEAGTGWEVTVAGEAGTPHMRGWLVPGAPAPAATPAAAPDAGARERDAAQLYARMWQAGNQFGPAFRCLRGLRTWPGGATAVLSPHPQAPPVVVLDAAVQALAAVAGDAGDALLLAGWDRLRLLRLPEPGCRLDARMRDPSGPGGGLTGDVVVTGPDGDLAVELAGVRLHPAPARAPAGRPSGDERGDRLVVAATFAAEPIAEVLSFWGDTLGHQAAVEVTPAGQVVPQLLDPESAMHAGEHRAQVLLLRAEDLLDAGAGPARPPAPVAPAPARAAVSFSLPGIGEIEEMARYETEYLYREIFLRQAYLRHGIRLADGAVVFDVGANIGMFTLFVHSRCANPRIFAFEPAPQTFEVLRRNVAAHCPGAAVFNLGLAAETSEQVFTFYPHSTVFSGFAVDPARTQAVIDAVIDDHLRLSAADSGVDIGPLRAHLSRGRATPQRVSCRTRRLSEVLAESGVPSVDLLKVDVEGFEREVLAGVDDQHWSMIKQVVVEVHHPDDAAAVVELLTRQGFVTTQEEEAGWQRRTGYGLVFARRSGQPGGSGSSSAGAVAAVASAGVDQLLDAVATAQHAGVPTIAVACPPSPAATRDRDRAAAVARTQDLLLRGLAEIPGVVVVAPEDVQREFPVPDYADPVTDELAGIPYHRRFFTALGTVVARRLHALTHPVAKVLVLDCDNTLWGGRCGEDGPAGLRVGPAHRAVQDFAVRQHRAGVLVCLSSRNNAEDVWAVFRQRDDLLLRPEHLAAWRLDWQPKSRQLRSLAGELGVAVDSLVFVDDDAVECAEVRAHTPEVVTLQLPADPTAVPGFLTRIWALDRPGITSDDRARTARIREERRRRTARAASASFADFLAGLDLRVEVAPAVAPDAARLAQLSQRVNQFTTTGTRFTEAQLRAALTDGPTRCLTVRVRDRFGDYGLVGAVWGRIDGAAFRVDAMLLSCRALNRGVEHRMVAAIGELALRQGAQQVSWRFVDTGRNAAAGQFLHARCGPPDRAAGGGVRFRLPAVTAARTVFEPGELAPPADPPPGGRTTQPGAGVLAGVHQRIVEELTDLDRIVEAVAAAQMRTRPLAPGTLTPPGDRLEAELAEVWREVLALDEIGVRDSFFALGGTSLLGVRLIGELVRRGMLAPEPAAVVSLYESSTVRAMAALLRGSDAAAAAGGSGHERGQRRRHRPRRPAAPGTGS